MNALRKAFFLAFLATGTAVGVTATAAPPTAAPSATVSVTLPTGKAVDAKKFVSPEKGSLEAAMIRAMTLIKDGQFDTYVSELCHSNTCPDAAAVESLKMYQLKSTQKTVHECMTEDGGILVTKRETSDDGSTRVYVFCGQNRMPAPSSLSMEGEMWKVTSFSW